MAEQTAIEWTESTWNPVRGCSRVSRGCGGPGKQGGCYAERIAARFSGPGQPFEGFAQRLGGEARWTGKVALVEDALTLPIRWRKPRRIFVNSMSDLFHEGLPDEAIDRVFAVMALAPQHTFQVLTKRPERARDYLTAPGTVCVDASRQTDITAAMFSLNDALSEGRSELRFTDNECLYLNNNWPLPNVWLGTSCEDQATADERIPHLLATPAAVRFVSAEPLLGPISFRWAKWQPINQDPGAVTGHLDGLSGIDWVIVGGESGPNARPMHPDWARDLRDQCYEASVAFFYKQWGEWIPDRLADPRLEKTKQTADGMIYSRVGKRAAGCELDGREHKDFPAALAA